ncbi:unnamed protein product [Ectocarpus sp. 6 AP-2014]
MATGEDRTVLSGLAMRLFQLMSEKATSRQWTEWIEAPLEHAVAEGDNDLAWTLLKAAANGGPGWKGCDDRTLLHAAAESGNAEVIRTVLDIEGVGEVDAVSGHEGRTALHYAAAGGHADAGRVLMFAGAKVDLVDADGSTGLHHAIKSGCLRLAEDMVIAGAGVRAKDRRGNTPLHHAAVHDDPSFTCRLLRRGAFVSATNKHEQRPLHIAVKMEHVGVAKALLKAGAGPNDLFTTGDPTVRFSPLYLARRNAAMTSALVGMGADVTSVDNIGYSALHWAVRDGRSDVVDALIEVGADVEARTSRMISYYSDGGHCMKGMTPLHEAAYQGNYPGMLVLLQKGRANANAQDEHGHSPLHILCMNPQVCSAAACSDILLRSGADETAADKDGHTPADIMASSEGHNGWLQQLLANAPADRAWRRRGSLVMLRAQGVQAENEATTDAVLPRLVGLQNEALFRHIVRFL